MVSHIFIVAYLLFIWRSNKSTRVQLKTSKPVRFVSKEVSHKQYPIPNILCCLLLQTRHWYNCTDRRSISKVIIALLLSSQSVLKMTNISPWWYGIGLRSQSNSDSRRLVPTCLLSGFKFYRWPLCTSIEGSWTQFEGLPVDLVGAGNVSVEFFLQKSAVASLVPCLQQHHAVWTGGVVSQMSDGEAWLIVMCGSLWGYYGVVGCGCLLAGGAACFCWSWLALAFLQLFENFWCG